jgi:transcriptional regulator
MTDFTADVRQGTLDMLILKAVSQSPMHGWGISQLLRETSRDVLRINQGSLYPALHRLERRGLIASEWAASENNRQARYYRLTKTGQKQLQAERADWERFMSAVQTVMGSI